MSRLAIFAVSVLFAGCLGPAGEPQSHCTAHRPGCDFGGDQVYFHQQYGLNQLTNASGLYMDLQYQDDMLFWGEFESSAPVGRQAWNVQDATYAVHPRGGLAASSQAVSGNEAVFALRGIQDRGIDYNATQHIVWNAKTNTSRTIDLPNELSPREGSGRGDWAIAWDLEHHTWAFSIRDGSAHKLEPQWSEFAPAAENWEPLEIVVASPFAYQPMIDTSPGNAKTTILKYELATGTMIDRIEYPGVVFFSASSDSNGDSVLVFRGSREAIQTEEYEIWLWHPGKNLEWTRLPDSDFYLQGEGVGAYSFNRGWFIFAATNDVSLGTAVRAFNTRTGQLHTLIDDTHELHAALVVTNGEYWATIALVQRGGFTEDVASIHARLNQVYWAEMPV